MNILEKRKNNCLSEVELDRYHLGEMSGWEKAWVKLHLAKCSFCGSRFAQRKSGLDGISGLNTEKMIHDIYQAISTRSNQMVLDEMSDTEAGQNGVGCCATDRQDRRGAYWGSVRTKLVLTTGLVAGVAIFLGFMLWTGGISFRPKEEKEVFRAKGGIGFQILRMQAGQMVPATREDRFYQHDRLGFVVDLVSDGHIMIVGVEENGRMYVAYPMDGRGQSSFMVRGSNLVLPGTIQLDSSVGSEWMVLVQCPEAFSLSQLKYDRENHGIAGPGGCVQKKERIIKE